MYYNLMGPPSYMQSVVNRNFVMWRIIPVLEQDFSWFRYIVCFLGGKMCDWNFIQLVMFYKATSLWPDFLFPRHCSMLVTLYKSVRRETPIVAQLIKKLCTSLQPAYPEEFKPTSHPHTLQLTNYQYISLLIYSQHNTTRFTIGL
jgi:hypothetical protein